MILNNPGRAIHTLYRWLSLAEQVTTPTVAETAQPNFLGAIQTTAQRLATTLQGIHGIENGIKIATQLSSPNPRELAQGCSELKSSLQGPDFGLALAITSSLQPDLEKELSRQSRKLRQLIEGGRIMIPTPTRQIALVASLIEEGPVPLTEILKVMSSRIHLLNAGAEQAIRAGGIFTYRTLEDLFSGKLEQSDFPTYSRSGGPKIVAFGGLVQAFVNMTNFAAFATIDEIPPEIKSSTESFFNFMNHPLLQLAFASYQGIENEKGRQGIRSRLDDAAFNGNGLLAVRRTHWDWVLRRPQIEIATDR